MYSRLRLLHKLALGALVIAFLAALVLVGFLIYTGETMPLGMVVAAQMGDQPVLYRPRYEARDMTFKLLSTNARHPEVLALGSSRVLQFRSMFFHKDSRAFYNAGAPAWTLRQVEDFLNGLDVDATPRILIIGLDHPWFNDAFFTADAAPEAGDVAQMFFAGRDFLEDVFKGESFDINMYLQRREPNLGGLALGLRAIRDGHGFRNDGSEQYGDFLVAHWLWPQNERQRHMDYVRDGIEMFVYGDTVSETAMARLESALQWCKDHDIYVIAYSPPYMPTLYDTMVERGNHTYMAALVPRLESLFKDYGFSYFDFSDGEQLGATDDDFFDGWHASERIYIRLYRQIVLALPDILGAYSDEEFLEEADENAADTFQVFGNQF